MSYELRCDRCGVVDSETSKVYREVGVLLEEHNEQRSWYDVDSKDLCDTCFNQLGALTTEWMERMTK